MEEYDRIVKEIRDELKKIKKNDDVSYEAWLKTLFEHHSNRHSMDNERIWKIGEIFIPLALTPLALLTQIENITLWHIYILAFSSITLIWSWLLIAENHRSFWQKSQAWMDAIQQIIGIKKKGPSKVKGNFLNRILTFKGAVQYMRFLITILITCIWIGILIFQDCII